MLLAHLAVVVLVQGSPFQERQAPARDYEIYNVVLDSLPEGVNRYNALIVNRTVTREGLFRRTVLRTSPMQDPDTGLIDSLATGSEAFTPHVLDSTALGPGVRFITDSAYRSIFSGNPTAGWAALRERHEGTRGVVHFSNVTYHSSGESAVVYVSMLCGSLCGRGQLVFLARKDGKWTITRFVMGWVS